VLVDLSRPMLERAEHRLKSEAAGSVKTVQSDLRSLSFDPGSFNLILAGQVLHHLREDAEWERMFGRFHQWLRPGGVLFVADFIAFDDPAIQELMMERYGEYLLNLGGAEFRDTVLACCEIEDSPRSTKYQLELLAKVGFNEFDVLHKNALFTAFYARKGKG
jgi:tRNA (cmo5U34)-methyltransferase